VALCLALDARFALRPGVGPYDWPKEVFYLFHARYALAVQHRLPGDFLVPWEGLRTYPALHDSLHYWSNPEVLTFTPWLLALAALKVATFIKVYLLAHGLLGAVGVALLGHRWRLPVVLTLALAALTTQGAWALRHYAMGYSPHVTALLAPWVVLALVAPRRDAVAAVLAAAVAVQALHQGSLHVFLWTLGAALAVAAFSALPRPSAAPPVARRLAGFVAAALALGAPKLLLTHAAYGSMVRPVARGYASVGAAVAQLVERAPAELPPRRSDFLWDGAIPVGWAGLLFLVGGGAALLARTARASPRTPDDRTALAALATALLCAALTLDGPWRWLCHLAPVLSVERYPYRFLVVAVWIAAAVAAREAARWWGRSTGARAALLALSIAVVASAWPGTDDAATVATSETLAPLLRSLNVAYATRHGAAR
jgi:hypothetical protein